MFANLELFVKMAAKGKEMYGVPCAHKIVWCPSWAQIFKYQFSIFRWFKFTLKPPYSGASEHSLLAI